MCSYIFYKTNKRKPINRNEISIASQRNISNRLTVKNGIFIYIHYTAFCESLVLSTALRALPKKCK